VIEALVVTLREGVEAALAVALVLVCLRRSGREDLSRAVYAGLAVAIGASLLGAWAFTRLELDEEATEGVLLLAAAAMTISLVVWMQRHGKTFRKEIESRMERITAPQDSPAAVTAGSAALWGVFAFTFFTVFREGVETVLLLAAVGLESQALLAGLGALVGLALAVGFGVALVRGAVRIDLARFFRVTTVLLWVFAIHLVVSGLHELAESGYLPMSRGAMAIIGPVVKSQALFLAALIACALVLLAATRRPASSGGESVAASGPERRLAEAAARRDRAWRWAAVGTGIFAVVSLTASWALTGAPAERDPAAMVAASVDEVRVPLSGLEPGKLHRFGVDLSGTTVRFLVVRTSDGGARTVLDACEICGARGYVQDGPRFVCLNCAADIVPSSLGSGGGCNPIPLPSRVEGDAVIIRLQDLSSRAPLFAGDAAGSSGR